MERKHVAVIGAGVLGLTTALELAKQGHGVTVLAKDLPGDWTIDYASPKAGAHFRPTSVTNAREAFENTLMHETYAKLGEICRTESTSGVEFVPAVEYFDTELCPRDLEMFSAWPQFRVLDPSELPQSSTIKSGLTYSAWVLNSPVYLVWLQRRAEAHGAVFFREQLTSVEEAFFLAANHNPTLPPPCAVVNASGMGFGDPKCFPSRGQFILISNEYDRTISHHSADGNATVIIPRPLGGGTVIGGTKEPSPLNSDAAVEEILRRVSSLCPDLLQPIPGSPDAAPALDCQEAYIGRRPMRKGGLRLETEFIDLVTTGRTGLDTETSRLPLVHCYGAGPSGYKISWGAAQRVTEMVNSL
ncbi:FAD dependent oxidoreductase superfamily [Purpureocillium lilacinum]|uniref:FAD dependent oxidoreductase superfamily n=1 Tax=Purpureocillium lilacinum TaxID=33203 RepID=A0A179H801_PURLI|nr:FAD dependent oxidoreductase superfamily [Purpureocillium lilacinum]OAQ86366.1 FAD dependent oxidoreductase superfamily [Purpureocillium lilacinum]OAQ94325.1 FAD dependent oxidoreductase superfamily [Purpureocillium lilacinum]